VTVARGKSLLVIKTLADMYRKHIRPPFSQTILLPNVYQNPGHTAQGQNMTPAQLQADFDRFYEDFYW
jgi:splicing factor U2AF subunit